MTYPEFATQKHNSKTIRRVFVSILATLALILILVIGAWYASAGQPPHTFPIDTDITIQEGMNLKEIGKHLEDLGVIDSSLIFQALFSKKYADESVKAGTYSFSAPLDVEGVISALTEGAYKTPLRKVTFPEGFRIANFGQYFTSGSTTEAVPIPQSYEGFLFPDTYFIENSTTQEELIRAMQKNYEAQLAPLRERIDASGFTENDIINLASILEREANDAESMRMVGGVLHNRLKIGMPLQVDATFEYLLGKTSAELTADDLLIDSPYNTYTQTGLPITPIGNPGLMAIEAVLDPAEHEYLYYLTSDDGVFYYAKTFEEHKQNKARYLR